MSNKLSLYCALNFLFGVTFSLVSQESRAEPKGRLCTFVKKCNGFASHFKIKEGAMLPLHHHLSLTEVKNLQLFQNLYCESMNQQS